MNAVKRCLALFAATLVVGACGGDPTAGDAGTDLTIRATPGAVWVRNNATAAVLIEAVDNLGGPAEGSWAAGTVTGPFTVALDPDYRPSSSGAIGTAARFVVTPTGEGEGSIVFTGTGGPITVPVRIAPDTNAFNVAFSTTTPALGATFTATAPAGTRFTETTLTTGINFYDGPLPLNLHNGLADPTIVSISPDSTVLTILPGPGATGQIRFVGIVSLSTPGLPTVARSADTVTVPELTVAATYSANTVAENAPVTITLPAGFKLRPTSQVFTTGAPAAIGATPLPAYEVSRAADSSAITVIPMPGFDTTLVISDLQWSGLPTLSLGVPTETNLTTTLGTPTQEITDLGGDDATAGPIGNVNVNIAAGEDFIFWDRGTWGGSDWFGIGGPTQDIGVTLTNAGNYTVEFTWDAGEDSDIDMVFFNSALSGRLPASGFPGATGANPEVITTNFPAGQFVINSGIFDGPTPAAIRIRIHRNS